MVLKFFLLFLLSFSACFPSKKNTQPLINGAGASFPYILYSKWISEYRKVEPQVAINYQSIGSGGGVRQFLAGALDFGGTDVPLSSKELKRTKKEILHIPTALGAVAVTYNLPSLKNKELKLTGEILADVFSGKITDWKDPKIQALNKGLNFPSKKILLIYRADGSGTTSFFTEFLSSKSSEFLNQIGKGKSVAWPVGLGAKGNEGVMGLLRTMEGAISYMGLSYARSQQLSTVAIKNKTGFFVQPTPDSIQASASQALKEKKAYTNSLIDVKGKASYPMSGYTYFILSKQMSLRKGPAMVSFIKWVLNTGQTFSKELFFIPLPVAVQKEALKQISQVKFQKK